MQRVLASLLLLALPLTALADGRFYAPTAIAANVTIPDQRALIHFTNGTERLVIETRFTGSGTNFAWVVPLPSRPVIEEASTGLFPTLQYLFRPEILHDVPRHYVWLLALVGISYVLLFVRPTGSVNGLDFSVCLLVGGGIGSVLPMPALAVGGFLVFLDLMCWVVVVRFCRDSRTSSLSLYLLEFFAVALTAFLLLPVVMAPAKSRGGDSAGAARDGGVSVLDRRLVGIFETATIASADPKALETWLLENGFALSTNSQPVIETYVKEGWMFVAAKVRRDKPERETSTPHPLSFTFKAAQAVYPMRLTGVDNGPLEVELYVFGPGRARAAHFKVERCTRPAYPAPPEGWQRWMSTSADIVHPLLRKWVEGSPVATKLTARLSPADLRQDVWLEWRSFAETASRRYSRSGAWRTALNWGTGALLAGMVVFFGLTRRSRGVVAGERRVTRLAVWSAAFGLVVALTIYFALPKTEVRLVRSPVGLAEISLWELAFEARTSTNLMRIAPVRKAVLETLNSRQPDRHRGSSAGWDNYLLGGRIHEEDSPGNFVLRETDGRVAFITYDAQGAEHAEVPGR